MFFLLLLFHSLALTLTELISIVGGNCDCDCAVSSVCVCVVLLLFLALFANLTFTLT